MSLSPVYVLVLGGTAAVDDAVVAAVEAALPGVVVGRIGGTDRYDTANRVAAAVRLPGSNYNGHVFVATGLNSPTRFPLLR